MRHTAVKRINWYGTIPTAEAGAGMKVFPRVESLTHRLLENGVLQINAVIKLFAVPGAGGEPPPCREEARGCYTRVVETSTFIGLRALIEPADIISIHHQVKADKITVRPGRISVIGSLKIEVEYLSPVVLNGRVTVFAAGQPLKGATVKLLDMEGGGELHETVTGSDGAYLFEGIRAGTYLVRAEAPGFEPQEQVAVIMLRDTVNFVLHRKNAEQEKDAV